MIDFGADTFRDSNAFSCYIETMAIQDKVSVLDALLSFCEKKEIEPTDVATHINKNLRAKLELNFIELNMLPKQATLPFF